MSAGADPTENRSESPAQMPPPAHKQDPAMLNQQLAESVAEKDALMRQLKDLQDTQARLHEQLALETQTHSQQSSALQSSLELLQEQRSAQQLVVESLEQECGTLRKEALDAKQELQASLKDHKQVLSACEEKDRDNARLAQKVNAMTALQDEMASLQNEAAGLRDRLSESLDSMSTVQLQLQQTEALCSMQAQELLALRSTLAQPPASHLVDFVSVSSTAPELAAPQPLPSAMQGAGAGEEPCAADDSILDLHSSNFDFDTSAEDQPRSSPPVSSQPSESPAPVHRRAPMLTSTPSTKTATTRLSAAQEMRDGVWSQLDALKSQTQSLQEKLDEVSRSLSVSEKEAHELKETLACRDTLLLELTAKCGGLEAQQASLLEVLREKAQIHQETSGKVDNLEMHVAELQSSLVAKDAAVLELKAALAAKTDELTGLRDVSQSKESILTELQIARDSLLARVAELDNQLAAVQQDLEAVQAAVVAKDSALTKSKMAQAAFELERTTAQNSIREKEDAMEVLQAANTSLLEKFAIQQSTLELQLAAVAEQRKAFVDLEQQHGAAKAQLLELARSSATSGATLEEQRITAAEAAREKDNAIVSLQAEHNSVVRELGALQNEHGQRVADLQAQLLTRDESVADLEMRLAMLTEQSLAQSVQLKSLQDAKAALEVSLLTQREQLEGLLQKEEHVAPLAAELGEKINVLESQLQAAKDTNAGLEKEVAILTERGGSLQSRVNEMEAAARLLDDQLQGHIGEAEGRERALESRKLEIAGLERAIEALRSENKQLHTAQLAASTEAGGVTELLQAKTEQVAALKLELEAQAQHTATLQTQLSQHVADKERLQNSVEALETARSDLNTQLHSSSAQLAAAQSLLDKQRLDIEAGQAALAAEAGVHAAHAKLKEELLTVQVALSTSENDAKRLRDECDAQRANVEALAEENNLLMTKLEESKLSVTVAAARHSQLQQELATLTAAHEALNLTNNQLMQQLTEAEVVERDLRLLNASTLKSLDDHKLAMLREHDELQKQLSSVVVERDEVLRSKELTMSALELDLATATADLQEARLTITTAEETKRQFAESTKTCSDLRQQLTLAHQKISELEAQLEEACQKQEGIELALAEAAVAALAAETAAKSESTRLLEALDRLGRDVQAGELARASLTEQLETVSFIVSKVLIYPSRRSLLLLSSKPTQLHDRHSRFLIRIHLFITVYRIKCRVYRGKL